MAQLIKNWVLSCEQCSREPGIDNKLTRPLMRNRSEHITGREVAVQNDMYSVLPPYGGY